MIINFEDLSKIRNENINKKIVFCSGSFDITHVGHIIFFEECNKYGNILIVGVGSDKMLRYHKGGNRPILNEHIRLKTIDSFKCVDYSFIDSVSTPDEPLILLRCVFESLKPDFYLINDDAFDIPYRERVCEEFKVKLIILKRWCPPEFEDISTSKIIEKIKNLDKSN